MKVYQGTGKLPSSLNDYWTEQEDGTYTNPKQPGKVLNQAQIDSDIKNGFYMLVGHTWPGEIVSISFRLLDYDGYSGAWFNSDVFKPGEELVPDGDKGNGYIKILSLPSPGSIGTTSGWRYTVDISEDMDPRHLKEGVKYIPELPRPFTAHKVHGLPPAKPFKKVQQSMSMTIDGRCATYIDGVVRFRTDKGAEMEVKCPRDWAITRVAQFLESLLKADIV